MADKSISSSFSDPLGMNAEIGSHRKQAIAALGAAARLLGSSQTSSVNDKTKAHTYTVTTKWTNDPEAKS